MAPFREQLILDLVRIGVAFGLFFVLVPRLLPSALYAPEDEHRYGSPCARFILTGTIYLLLVHIFVALGIFDPVLYLGCVAGLALVSLAMEYRGARGVKAYAGVLRFLETRDWRSRLRRSLGRRIDVQGSIRPSRIVPAALILAIVVVRGRTFWESLNPHSFAYYDLLYDVKSLRISQMFAGGVVEERGLHAFALVLQTFSQAGVEPVVRLVGLISVVVLGYVIFVVTTAVARSQLAGVTAASLFGILGVWWPPLGLPIHTEADPLPLATAFLLAALFFAARYILHGRRAHLLVACAALLSCVLISFPVGAIGGALLAVEAVAYLILSSRGTSLRALVLLPLGVGLALALGVTGWTGTGGAVALGLLVLSCLILSTEDVPARALIVLAVGSGVLLPLGAAILTGPHLITAVDPYLVPRFEVVTNTIVAVDERTVPETLIVLSVLAAGALFWLSRTVSATVPRMTARVSGLAVGVLGGIAWLGTTVGIRGLEGRTPVFMLSVFLCVAAGLLVVPLWRRATRHVVGLMDEEGLRNAYLAGCLMVVGSIWPAVSLPQVDHDSLQPPGYALAYEEARGIVDPGDWTVVGHEGLRVQVMNDGYFMRHEEFLSTVDLGRLLRADTVHHLTTDIFVFVDARPDESLVRDELNPPAPEISRRVAHSLARWTARSPRVSLFHEDESVRVYRIRTRAEDPAVRAHLFSAGSDS